MWGRGVEWRRVRGSGDTTERRRRRRIPTIQARVMPPR
jgi:hypothetical protein